MRLLDALLRHGTLRRAAVELKVSQPAASAMLNDVESLFGVRIFDRSHRGLAPTPSGAKLIARSRTLLNDFDALERRAAQLRDGEPISFRVGAVPHAVGWVAGIALDGSIGEPLRLEIADGKSPELLERLLGGQLDCVVGRLPAEGMEGEAGDQLAFVPLYEEQMSFVASLRHPLARRRRVTYTDLVKETWVLPPSSSNTRRAFAEAFLRNGLTPPAPAVELPSYLYALEFVSTTRMLTIAPRTSSLRHARRAGVAVLSLPVAARPMHVSLIWRKSAGSDPMIVQIRSALQRAAPER